MILISQQFISSMITVLIVLIQYIQADGLIEVFRWKQMDFYNRGNDDVLNENPKPPNMINSFNNGAIIFPDAYPFRRNKRNLPKITSRSHPIGITNRVGHNDNNDMSSSYIPYSNVPMGVTHFNGRLFITMPRRRIGIPSTLNYIDIQREQNNPSPKLRAYPNYITNSLKKNSPSSSNKLISVYRTTVDACKRLWFIDTGMLEYPGDKQQIQRPSIWTINLLTDQMVNRFEIPQEIVTTGEGLASITIDVTINNCEQAFAYIPDLLNAKLYVYSLQENRIWRFNHNYFNFDPLGGDLTVGGQRFRWDDGIFSITLGPYLSNGFRIALFHAMASTNEFMVSTEVLRNETNSQRSDHGNDFMLVGNRGPMRQSTMHEYDPSTGVIFYAEIQRNGVGCWNKNKKFSPENHGTVAQDPERMIYPSDLTIDDENTMWLMTNSMPIYIYSSLDPNVVNFRVWKRKTTDAITNTICE